MPGDLEVLARGRRAGLYADADHLVPGLGGHPVEDRPGPGLHGGKFDGRLRLAERRAPPLRPHRLVRLLGRGPPSRRVSAVHVELRTRLRRYRLETAVPGPEIIGV